MDKDHEQLLAFLREAEKLKSTLRHNWMTSGRQEDASQHSWRAALLFLLLHELSPFEVDAYKTLMMLIIHDLPEAIHGDIAAFIKDTDQDQHSRHKLREQQAAKELYSLLPASLDKRLFELHEEFEAGETNEAKVAQALEKIESQLQHLESGPNYWSDEERGQHMLHYPDNVLKKLDDKRVSALWKKIYDEIYKLTYPEGPAE
jgi:putative hydrolase of HD superfamily